MENTQGTGAGLLLAGRYRLGESIGRGGMGRVWRADDEVLNRVVAIKELTAGMYASEADRTVLHARTRKEARAAARISHPGVVTVHDVLDHDQRPWIVMQYVDGPSLADAVKASGRVPAVEAARIGLQVLRALDAAHTAGVLHRDVKPANILLGADGRSLITDFGIAAIEGDATITRTGEIVGSIDYLAPERVRGGDPGPASDLWSLGATLYTAVEGESPFRRSSPLTTMQAVVTDEPRPPQYAGPLTPVILALLDKDPARRPSGARAEEMFRAVTEGREPDTATTVEPLAAPTVTMPAGSPAPPAASAHPSSAPAGSLATPGGYTGTVAAGGASATTVSSDSPPAGRRGGKRRAMALAAVAVVLVALTGIGTHYAVQNARDKAPVAGGREENAEPTTGRSPGATVRDSGDSPGNGVGGGDGDGGDGGDPVLPEGWQRVQDPAGFSLLLPQGWTRTKVGEQIDYSPDNGLHRLRIGIDREPDFDSPYRHLLDLDANLREKLPDYQRIRLDRVVYRDQTKAARWEFAWTEKRPFPGPRKAVDLAYYDDQGVEYALYLDGPAADWKTTLRQFRTILQSWEAPR
ncbi:serine/threonine-protein kinase [Streptomyces sp. NPDC000594]|uniref:serine/threonine-protein kinase n=1 Tax=Streptomyces sp. NPDC000594 TaxID=3154261 RepID=UPI00331D6757